MSVSHALELDAADPQGAKNMKLTISQLLLIGCLTVIPSPVADQSDATGRRINQASARKSLPTFSIPALAATAPPPQPAFPGAEGFGRYAQGGRGGDVYYVVNLNDSGPGSLREGLRSATGPRTIVFGVSGTIALKSRLAIDKPYITIAGQTAPGDGITLRDAALGISADHTVVRYIRSRLGDKGIYKGDAVSVSRGSNVIIDHCSASWSIDEVLSMTSGADLVTLQWSIVSEALFSSIHPKLVRRAQESGASPNSEESGGHSMGGILGAKRQTLHHNLYAHNNSRNPKISGKPRLVAQVDFRNNVIYNWGAQSCYDGSFAHVNWANNYYRPGPGTTSRVTHRIFRIDNWESKREKSMVGDTHALFFIDGNYVVGFPEVSANNWAGGVDFGGEGGLSEANTRAKTPFDYPRIACETDAQQAYDAVLASAGASLARDSIDKRIVQEARSGTVSAGYLPGVLQGKGPHGIIRSQKEVGGWPVLRSAAAPVDSDRDGMPDWWEIAHKLNPNDAADRNLDRDADGYTNLEEYLNWLAEPAGRFLEKHPARAKAN
jgi:pectate lyase